MVGGGGGGRKKKGGEKGKKERVKGLGRVGRRGVGGGREGG